MVDDLVDKKLDVGNEKLGSRQDASRLRQKILLVL